MPLSAGERLGPYEILNQLGAGGMGEVYKARDTRLGREVAIKVSHEQFTERFEREARAVAALNHHNICHLYDVGPNYIVMELVNGTELQGPVDLETALHYARQICDALEAAHEKGIVHRDLKPANINVKPDGSLKVLDFGLAKTIDELAGDPHSSPTMTMSTTQAGMILGTAAYMSPEQARGRQVDKRADIWAFGCVLYETITGEQAFKGETISDLFASVLREEPDLSKVPASIRPALARCFAKDPRRRWRDIGDVRMALDDAPPAVGEAAAPVAIERTPIVPWAIAGLLGITLAAALYFLWPHPPPPARLLRLPVSLGADAQVRGSYGTLAISPDGSRLVFGVRNPDDGVTRLAVRSLDQAKAIQLAGTEGARDPFFSPDGQWVAFAAANKLKKIPSQGGAVEVLCDAPNFRGGSWGSSGTIVAALNSWNPLSIVPENGGPAQSIGELAKGETSQRWPQLLANGNVIYTTKGVGGDYRDASVIGFSPATGKRTELAKEAMFGRYLPSGHLLYTHEESLYALRMDPQKLQVSGTAVRVMDGVFMNDLNGWAGYSTTENGTVVAVASESSLPPALYWETDSGAPLLIAKYPGAYSIELSPDGNHLVTAARDGNTADIWVYDLTRDTRTRFTFDGRSENPLWTPDGKFVVYQNFNTHEVWAARADGSLERTRLFKSGNKGFQIESFTPDGKRLLLALPDATSGLDLWSMTIEELPNGTISAQPPQILIKSPFNEQSATISPDGKWMAYVSDESGAREVYVTAFPGPGGRWQISTNSGNFPVWSKKTNDLLFLSGDRMMAASYQPSGPMFNADKPRKWSNRLFLNPSNYRLFALHPDGKKFLRLRPFAPGEGEVGQEATFLLNFFDELKRRVPVK